MSNKAALVGNFLTIANNIQCSANCFRIKKENNGLEAIKKNNFFERLWFGGASESAIQEVVKKNVEIVSGMERGELVDGIEPTPLFLAAQKYNQTIAQAAERSLLPKSLSRRVVLNQVHNPKVTELNPARVVAVTDVAIPEHLQKDKPEIVKEKRYFKDFEIRRYPGDRIDHMKEGSSIFISTQRERFLSAIGRIVEAVAKMFGKEVTSFQKYHYRKNNETNEQIYAETTNPFSQTSEPTSYWLGHASLFLSIPLVSDKGTKANFYAATDLVENGLVPIIYPRQEKFAMAMEKMPAISLYFLSHNHFDHYDKDTIRKILAGHPTLCVPKGDGKLYEQIAKEEGFEPPNIIEMDWWEKKSVEIEKNGELYRLQVSAIPARHWSGQGPCGGHESMFLGYVIQGCEKGDIYFAGDTARLNEDHIVKLKNHFNIRWSFQPGGPDEVRKDMQSTHQASVDALWMHFKVMVPKIYREGMKKEEFLRQASELKTVYMHTMAFKLGNLHVSDTKESVEQVINALMQPKRIEELSLKSYEKQVYQELCEIAQKFKFSDNEKLLPQDVAQLLKDTVIVPKIGSRIGLETSKNKQSKALFF